MQAVRAKLSQHAQVSSKGFPLLPTALSTLHTLPSFPQDSALAFLWSRMLTVDEIKDYNKYTSLTFIDFLEALGRVADMKSLPLESELEAAGGSQAGGTGALEGLGRGEEGQGGCGELGENGQMDSLPLESRLEAAGGWGGWG